jgi:hypothetical protein
VEYPILVLNKGRAGRENKIVPGDLPVRRDALEFLPSWRGVREGRSRRHLGALGLEGKLASPSKRKALESVPCSTQQP